MSSAIQRAATAAMPIEIEEMTLRATGSMYGLELIVDAESDEW